MTFTDASPHRWQDVAEAPARTDPPKSRVTPPLLMGDILASRNGVPVFVTEWLRLERERDARREARANQTHSAR